MTFFPRDIDVERTGAGSYSEDPATLGIWVPGPTSIITIEGSIQPLTAKEIDALEIGERATGNAWIYTEAELLTSSTPTSNDGDLVLWRGKKYRVRTHDPFDSGVIPHNRYRAELWVDA